MDKRTGPRSRSADKGDENNFDVGLVLSGGAARGFVHAGVLKALAERSLSPGIISGVSAGAIVGSFYCDGFEPEEICEIFQKDRIFEFVKLKFKRHGIFSTEGLREVLKKNLRSKRIEDLRKSLVVTATNIDKRTTSYFTEGDLVERVLASASLPVLFHPTIINGNNYVDGGVTNNFPLEPIEGRCKTLVGVHANPVAPYDPKKGLLHMATSTFHLCVKSDIERKSPRLDYFIEPTSLKKYGYFDVRHGKEMYEIGYKEAVKVLNGESLQKESLK
jgi:NTE family protein